MPLPSQDSASQSLTGVQGRRVTPEEVARRDGYVQGHTDEDYVQRNLRERERALAQSQANDNAASGMLLGLLVALIAGGIGAAAYFLNSSPAPVAPIAAPQIQKETIKETTIIEKETPAPAVSLPDVKVPDIKVPEIKVPEIKIPDINTTKEAPAEAPAAESDADAVTEPAPAQ